MEPPSEVHPRPATSGLATGRSRRGRPDGIAIGVSTVIKEEDEPALRVNVCHFREGTRPPWYALYTLCLSNLSMAGPSIFLGNCRDGRRSRRLLRTRRSQVRVLLGAPTSRPRGWLLPVILSRAAFRFAQRERGRVCWAHQSIVVAIKGVMFALAVTALVVTLRWRPSKSSCTSAV